MARLSKTELEVSKANPLKDRLNPFCTSFISKFPDRQSADAGNVAELLVSEGANAGEKASPQIAASLTVYR